MYRPCQRTSPAAGSIAVAGKGWPNWNEILQQPLRSVMILKRFSARNVAGGKTGHVAFSRREQQLQRARNELELALAVY
jgi:hypothetical protein